MSKQEKQREGRRGSYRDGDILETLCRFLEILGISNFVLVVHSTLEMRGTDG
jgi:hypothetical protein